MTTQTNRASETKSRIAHRIQRINIILLALILVLVITVAAMMVGNIAADASKHYARSYSVETVGKFGAYLNHELTLVGQVARSKAVTEWFAEEDNPQKRLAAYETMMGYADSLQSANLYFGIDRSLDEYSINSGAMFSDFTPFDVIDPNVAYNRWYFDCLESEYDYTLNIDVDKVTHTRRLWINYKVVGDGELLGVFCSGLMFDTVAEELFGNYTDGNVLGYIIDGNGIIQFDSSRVAAGERPEEEEARNIRGLHSDPLLIEALDTHFGGRGLFTANMEPEIIKLEKDTFGYVSIAPIANTDWLSVTFYNAASLYSARNLLPLLAVMLAAFVIYSIVSNALIRRLVLKPLGQLTQSLSQDNEGDGAIFGSERADELGELSRNIINMRTRLSTYNFELREVSEERRRQENLMKAVNGAASVLLASDEKNLEPSLQEGMELMARCMDVDRIHIWRNSICNGALCFSHVTEWVCDEEMHPARAPQAECPYAVSVPRWEQLFKEGECVNGSVDALPVSEQEWLEPFRVESVLAIPVRLRDQFWGYISYDDCHRSRIFTEEEVNILRSGGLMLASAVMRVEETARMREADERAKLMLDATPLCCNFWSEDYENIDCNEEAVNLFELRDKQEYLDRFFELSPEYQPDGRLSSEKARENVTTAFRDGKIVFEWMHQKLDGTPIPAEITLVRVKRGDSYIVLGYTRDLREYRKMMAESREADERAKLMLDATPLCCNFWSEDYENIDCNEEAVNLFGLRNKQEYLDRFFDLSPEYQPDGTPSPEKAASYIREAFENGRVVFEWMHQKLDGTPIPAEITLVRVKRGDSYIVLGYTRDLREYRKMMAETREADERAKLMLDATPLCCNLWDKNFNNIDCNEEAVNLFGLRDKQEYLDRFFELSPEYQPDGTPSPEKAASCIRQAFENGRVVFDWMHQKLDGTPIPAEITLVRVKRGEDYIVAGYTRDMRENKKMMAEIEHRDALLHTVNDAATTLLQSEIDEFEQVLWQCMGMLANAVSVDRVYIWKNSVKDGKLYCNQVYEWSEGAEPQQGGKYTVDIPYDENIPGWEETLSNGRCVNGAVSSLSQAEQDQLSPQGILSILVVPVFLQDEFWGFVGFDDCHTERSFTSNEESILRSGSLLIANAMLRNEMTLRIRQNAADLEKAVELAQAASRAKSDFLSNMSHEMRTPMNAIIGMTAIGKAAKDTERKDYAFGKIEDASTHLLGVINDVLDMSKIEANKFELSETEFDFERMLQKTVTVSSFRMDEKRQDFTVFLDKEIPRLMIGDDQRLSQVIANLLSNAVKFTPEGGTIRLYTKLEEVDGDVYTIRFGVTDSGIGISEEQQQRLFTSFEQAESSTSRKFGGTGLGLAISKRIVMKMGGKIWLESQLGKGSTFEFTVKLLCGAKKRRALLDPGRNWGNLRVLMVDDDAETRAYFLTMAEGFKLSCDVAAGGKEAMELIERNGAYDIYFVDWRMPEMDGVQLARLIREKSTGPSVVIMISASGWNEIEGEAKTAGVDGYLAKPLFPSAIVDCINECLGLDNNLEGDNAQTDVSDCFEGRHVLLVEDVEINREIVQALLSPTGIEIDCAVSGVQALEMFTHNPGKYDVIFMDVQMPEMDGLEATRRIRAMNTEESARIPIVAMTANVFREDVENCRAAGMDDHVGKPIDIDEVLEKLRKYIIKR